MYSYFIVSYLGSPEQNHEQSFCSDTLSTGPTSPGGFNADIREIWTVQIWGLKIQVLGKYDRILVLNAENQDITTCRLDKLQK